MKDLEVSQRDYALYLPALSSFYVKQLEQMMKDGRVPAGFELGNEGLDFLRDSDAYFRYPFALYSAGHATLDLKKADAERMVQKRNRASTVVLGDSGGYQVATGVIKMDWSNASDPNDPERLALCEKILRWLEHTSDWSMILDVPSSASVPPQNKKTGLTDVQKCIDITCLNVDYFMRNRVPGATKFLNVISGNDETSSDNWYAAVKKFSDPQYVAAEYGDANRTLEGFAIAGQNKANLYLALKRLMDLVQDGLLQGKGWIHFLGTGKLNWACYLTSIQRVLRQHYSENIHISFDAASPFLNTAYGQCYSYNYFSPKKFGYFMDRAIDSQSLKGSDLPMPFGGPIMERLTAGDVCMKAAGDLDKNGKPKAPGATSWDTQSYMYYMAHSVYNHITAVQEANRLADLEAYRANIHYSDWIPDKRSKNTNEFSPYVPYGVVYFDSFVREFFDPENPDPYGMLRKYRGFLEEISNTVISDQTSNSEFFEFGDTEQYDAEDQHVNYEDIVDQED